MCLSVDFWRSSCVEVSVWGREEVGVGRTRLENMCCLFRAWLVDVGLRWWGWGDLL